MIHVFVSPGTLNGKPLRSILYDTVSDKYGQFLLEELLPEVYAKYNIRKDAYSRAIQGQSSGGIAAFTVAFNRPDAFSRDHHAALAASELPVCLTWLWRDYDPNKTEQIFEQSAEEKSKPPFRVRIYNR